jgi:cytoskeletal protein RodZ
LTTRVRGRRIHRMKLSALAAGVLTCVLASAAVASAQLGDVARKEAERRKTVKSSGKTYTNDTLPSSPSSSSSAPASSGAQSPSDTSSAPPSSSSAPATSKASGVSSDPEQRKKDEAQWRERMKGERDALDRAKTFADALQTKINALNTDFVNRDDPAQRSVIAADRDKAIAEMGRLKKEIAEHTKAIAGIQEEARRAGVPAGWVR